MCGFDKIIGILLSFFHEWDALLLILIPLFVIILQSAFQYVPDFRELKY